MFASDGLLRYPFPAIESGFTMWGEFHETTTTPLDFPSLDHQALAFSTFNEPDQLSPPLQNKKMKPGSYEPVIDDERRLRRMESNRESARRSRVRKQKHLENLREEMNRLRTGKRELANRLEFLLQQNRIRKRENDGLRCESEKLRQKLWLMRQILILQHLSHNNNNNN
ncbi:bZIP transcription factor 11 [Impatiens glandulifera]|uniref:bZIP transcription factor 11 n=1 Tax=Impatiens glandulifera TaxID=253017 RepID=UPI001FB12D52|nr:bZIP transcription factor 11 [Impatiens glandulifera]